MTPETYQEPLQCSQRMAELPYQEDCERDVQYRHQVLWNQPFVPRGKPTVGEFFINGSAAIQTDIIDG